MNSLEYFGHGILDYMAAQFLIAHGKKDDGYHVVDINGESLCGLVSHDNSKPIHRLQVKESARC